MEMGPVIRSVASIAAVLPRDSPSWRADSKSQAREHPAVHFKARRLQIANLLEEFDYELVLIRHWLVLIRHWLVPIRHWLVLIGHWLVLIRHWLVPIRHWLALIEHWLVLRGD